MGTSFFNINGIRVANIKNDSEIAFFAIVVNAGSNYENKNNAGISHIIEHMMFKGTKNRTYSKISEDFARLGVSNNAATDNSDVSFYATCPKENLNKTIEILMDMFFNSTFPAKELEKERNVILEEKKMYLDDPTGFFFNEIGSAFFEWEKGHNTIGTDETIKSVNKKDIKEYLDKTYTLDNFIFICCGNINDEDLKKYIYKNIPENHAFSRYIGINSVSDRLWTDIINSKDKIKLNVTKEGLQQAQILMLTRGLGSNDEDSYAANVLLKAVGGGAYSKLYTRIREKLGLCYSVNAHSFYMAYPNHLINAVSGSTSHENIDLFIEETEKIIKSTRKNGIDKNLFECAKIDQISSLLRHIETSKGKAEGFLKRYLFGNYISVEEYIKSSRSVTLKDCNRVAERILNVDKCYWAVLRGK